MYNTHTKIKPIRSNKIIKHSPPLCRKSQYVKIQIHCKWCSLALLEAALSAWPLWPANTTGWELCPGQQPRLGQQQWLHHLLWAPVLLLKSSQVWWPCHCSQRGCGFCVWPRSGSHHHGGFGGGSLQGLPSLTRSLKELSCQSSSSSMAHASFRWNSFWHMSRTRVTLSFLRVSSGFWNSADWWTD